MHLDHILSLLYSLTSPRFSANSLLMPIHVLLIKTTTTKTNKQTNKTPLNPMCCLYIHSCEAIHWHGLELPRILKENWLSLCRKPSTSSTHLGAGVLSASLSFAIRLTGVNVCSSHVLYVQKTWFHYGPSCLCLLRSLRLIFPDDHSEFRGCK